MIARIWHGTTHADKADEYLQLLSETGLPDYKKTPGNLGAYVLRHVEDGIAHFFTLSFWDSFDSVKLFAGPDHSRAKYYPEDAEFLLTKEPEVSHFELYDSPTNAEFIRNPRRRGLPRWW